MAFAIFLLAGAGWGPTPAQDVILDAVSTVTDGFILEGFGTKFDLRLENMKVEEPLSHWCAGRGYLPLSGPHCRGAWRFGPRGHYYCGAKPQWWPLWLLVTAAIVGLSVLLSQIYRAVADPLASTVLGRIRTAHTAPLNAAGVVSNIRQVFRRTYVPVDPVSDPSHTHPIAASVRNTALATAAQFAQSLGQKLFDVQQSAASYRKFRGSRVWFWATDALVPSRPLEDGVRMINDTDYHADMHSLLSSSSHPTLIGTVNPTAAARSTPEYDYTFTENNLFKYEVRGGAKFHHPLWDYNHDHVRVIKRGLAWEDHTTLNVEMKALDEDHVLVCLVPEVRQRAPAPWAFLWLLTLAPYVGWWAVAFAAAAFAYRRYLLRILEAPILSQLEPVQATGEEAVPFVTKLRVKISDGDTQVSVGIPGKYASTTVPLAAFDALVMSSSPKNLPTLGRVRNVLGLKDDVTAAPVSLIASVLKAGEAVMVQQAVNHVIDVVPVVKGCTPDIRHDIEDFGTAFVAGGNFRVARSAESDAWTIQERVMGPVAGRKPATVNPFLTTCIGDFVSSVLGPARGKLHPVGPEVVRAKQNRPTQQVILDKADGTTAITSDEPLRNIPKGEVVARPKAKRNITTYPAEEKAEYSRFMYAVQDFLAAEENGQHWYMPGRTPAQIAERVTSICQTSQFVNNADAEKLDARISAVNRALEEHFAMCAFAPEYHADLMETQSAQHGRKCVTMYGKKYNMGLGRGSGSGETTCFNTLNSGFHSYLGFRNKKDQEGNYYTHDMAWQLLVNKVAAFGDDLVVGDLPEDNLCRAGAWCGHVYVCDIVQRGNLGVNFLNRFYTTDVWCGSPNSMVNLTRALPKLYSSVKNQLTPEQRLDARLFSYALTDRNTPILGKLVKRYVTVFGKFTQDADSWWAQFEMENQWPNEPSDDHMDYACIMLPGFDWERFETWLSDAGQDYEYWLNPPVLCTLAAAKPPAVRAIVGNDLVQGPEVVVQKRVPKEPGAKRKPPIKASVPAKMQPKAKTKPKGAPKQAGRRPGAKAPTPPRPSAATGADEPIVNNSNNTGAGSGQG